MAEAHTSRSDIPGGDKGVPWHDRSAPGRISPRECVRQAQEQMNQAWSMPNGYAAMEFIRGSVDWLRRALEQMAPSVEAQQAVEAVASQADEALQRLKDDPAIPEDFIAALANVAYYGDG